MHTLPYINVTVALCSVICSCEQLCAAEYDVCPGRTVCKSRSYR